MPRWSQQRLADVANLNFVPNQLRSPSSSPELQTTAADSFSDHPLHRLQLQTACTPLSANTPMVIRCRIIFFRKDGWSFHIHLLQGPSLLMVKVHSLHCQRLPTHYRLLQSHLWVKKVYMADIWDVLLI
ncbi:hypothetical protein Ahy_B09g100247 isoform A [Arachis hypogaea]|uniref:Uncharacterized protein n=1 Tax=Arachis hypogaea TaxID=3818 RepID=A0A444XWB9_ARAHY|nr:hypothetical protein Ahy_B09g100247 isoform A [Arachis hypogaea]